MTLLLSDDDVRAVADVASLVDSMRRGLQAEARGAVQLVPRINFGIQDGFFRVMPVVIEELDVMGFKVFDAKFPEVRYLVAVYRPSTGELDCLLDAAYLTALRTGATTGVATDLMTDVDACREVGVIGSGLEARTNLEGIIAVRDVERVKVFSRDPQRRERMAQELRDRFHIDATAVADAAAAADAPCVLAATNTGFNGPFAVQGAWLRPEAHLNTIGATTPTLREVEPSAFAKATRIVLDTEHAGPECGDIIAAEQAGLWPHDRVVTLADLVDNGANGVSVDGLTIFKSVGTAVQDILAAAVVAERARERGLGREVELVSAKRF
jgi:alanine dehydrogenase